MANAGDKITSWQSLYDAINRVINLPATGSASAFTATTALDNNDVAPGNSIDDDDLNNLITRYNAIKTDSLYGSSNQLTSDGHTSSTINLYSVNPSSVTAGTLLSSVSDAEVNNIVNNLNTISCRNIVSCYKTESYYCRDAYYTATGCDQSRYSGCSNRYYTGCDQHVYKYVGCSGNRMYCYNAKYCRKINCSGQVCSKVGCYSQRNTTYCYVASCGNNYYYCCESTNYYTCSANCNNESPAGCNQYSCTRCTDRSYQYHCGDTTTYSYVDDPHNDILCNNSYWNGN